MFIPLKMVLIGIDSYQYSYGMDMIFVWKFGRSPKYIMIIMGQFSIIAMWTIAS